MSVMKQGSRGADVRRLQEALNRKLPKGASPLVVDGDYGPRTRMAVLKLQAAHWLVEDGIAGPATQSLVFEREVGLPILHPVALIPQPAPTQCWAAGTAMITRATVAAVVARTPPELIGPDGALCDCEEGDAVDERDAAADARRYASAHGLDVRPPPKSWQVGALREALNEGPLMIDTRWNAKEYAARAGSPGHMIVVAGIRGDGDPSGRGTTLRIFDPWPLKKGTRRSVHFAQWIEDVPARAYRLFQR